jgi:hypothetical protein
MNDENKEQIKIQAHLVKNNIKVFTILAALGALMTIGCLILKINELLAEGIAIFILGALFAVYYYFKFKKTSVTCTNTHFIGTNLFGEINVTLDKLTRVYKKQARKLRSSGVGFLVVEVEGKKYKYGPVKDIDLLVADINKLKADYMNDTTSAV